jgi:hypothetical protein
MSSMSVSRAANSFIASRYCVDATSTRRLSASKRTSQRIVAGQEALDGVVEPVIRQAVLGRHGGSRRVDLVLGLEHRVQITSGTPGVVRQRRRRSTDEEDLGPGAASFKFLRQRLE